MEKLALSIEDLYFDWRAAGIEEGDVVLLHSSMARTVRRFARDSQRPGITRFVESFLQAVGDSGTVLFPLFNFGFSNGEPFDIRNTPSKMGKLTEAARLYPRKCSYGASGLFIRSTWRTCGQVSRCQQSKWLRSRFAVCDFAWIGWEDCGAGFG